MKKYYSVHPNDAKKYDTKQLREKFLVENLFKEDVLSLIYSFDDRIIIGGVIIKNKNIILNKVEEIKSDYFLERREMGIFNIGETGIVTVDNVKYILENKDALYLSKGCKEIIFEGKNAKFYFNSVPSHKEHENKHIKFKNAKAVIMGSIQNANSRTIYQYIHPDVCNSSQLCMGLTILNEGSIWNTMPPHTHDRRMEVYLYFDICNDAKVFHMMGEKDETRHLLMSEGDVAISPSWSIHAGAGISNYSFIWGMCGENQVFDDMDHIKIEELR